MKPFLISIMITLLAVSLYAQDYRQTVRGRITDKESLKPLEFASVTITSGDFLKGGITDANGNFVMEGVPVGRATLNIRFVGYQPVTIPNLDVTSGKELVLDLELTESTIALDEVMVKPSHGKAGPLNSFAPVSARTFSVEESHRYAGSANDVARMAMNFAGVKSSYDAVNEIVIRGNSPVGLLFRLEGVDIPNPSHFGDGGTTGGPISMLNNNVLANSDFLTGAFPAEYGNAISGVFDLRMRNGNDENHEFLAQVSLNSLELGAEGPISGKSRSSYLVNYRYSTFKLMSMMGFEAGLGTAVPDYQDLSFKLNFPSRRIGNISLFGFGGTSHISMLDSERDTSKAKEEMAVEADYEMDFFSDNYSGVVGLVHSYVFCSSAYTRFSLAVSTISNSYTQDSLSTETRDPFLQYVSDFQRTKGMARFYLNKKFNSRNTMRAGISAERQFFHLLDSMYDGSAQSYRVLRDYNGGDFLLQPYVQYHYRCNERLQFDVGLTSFVQLSINQFAMEPRTGIKWTFSPGNTLSFGYGLHSITSPVELREQKVWLADGEYSMPNQGLGFTRSHHFVLAFDRVFTGKIRFKTEAYYQAITDAAVEHRPGSWSILNRGSYTFVDVDSLRNGGSGYNYGLELTLEKFMDRGMYGLSTLSLYDSKYRGSDGVLRNTAFNSNFVFNLLGGKEFRIGKSRQDTRYIKKIALDGKLNWAGGQYYTPVDLEASRENGRAVYDDANAYSLRLPFYFKLDFRWGMKFIGKQSTQEIAIDISNLTNRQNPFYIKYDIQTGELRTIYQFGIIPQVLYRISF